MNYRESSILRRPGRRSRRRRSGLRIFLFILLGVLVFTALGFGISLILRGGASKQTDPSQNPSGNPLPCATKMITPAEVLPFSNEVKVTVLNGTNRIGLAGDTAKVLKARGFLIKGVGNDPSATKTNGVAVIRYGPAGTSGAQLLGFHFPGAVLVNDGRSGKVVEVSIGKDFDKLQGESEIAAAMASPSPSTKGPGCASPGAAPTASASAPASSSEPSSS